MSTLPHLEICCYSEGVLQPTTNQCYTSITGAD